MQKNANSIPLMYIQTISNMRNDNPNQEIKKQYADLKWESKIRPFHIPNKIENKMQLEIIESIINNLV